MSARAQPSPSDLTGSAGLLAGQMHPRMTIVVKNGRWLIVGRSGISQVGWGDLSAGDLERLRGVLDDDVVFVVCRERAAPTGAGPRWGRYDEALPSGVTVAQVVRNAVVVVTGEGVAVVAMPGSAAARRQVTLGHHVFDAVRPEVVLEILTRALRASERR